MKIQNIFIFFAAVFVACAFFACTNQKDIYKDYLAGGEEIYLVKTDSVHVRSGKNRVRIKCLLRNAYNVDKIWVYWNSGADSMSFDYVKSANDADTLNLDIPNLPEKSYQFQLFTKNSFGDRSIGVTTFGTAYGERYESLLNTRVISRFVYLAPDVTLTWLSSAENERGTEVVYTNNLGESAKVIALANNTRATLTNFLTSSTIITYRSMYMPDSTCLDTFKTAWSTYNVPIIVK